MQALVLTVLMVGLSTWVGIPSTSTPLSTASESFTTESGPILAAASQQKSTLFLTYDDGSSRLTPSLLDILDEYPHVKVTFFVNCREAVSGTFQRILDAGHAIANHTCSHADMTTLSSLKIRSELRSLESFVNARVRHDVEFKTYRPPFGATNDRVRAAAAAAGYREWMWSVDPQDWKRPGVDSIVASLESMKDGDVVLLHDSDGKEQTLRATDIFLAEHAEDYAFAALPGTYHVATPQQWDGRFWDDDNSIFEADIEAIADRGVTRGCNPPTNDRFCPAEHVTRGQLASFIVRAAGLESSTVDAFRDDDGSLHEDQLNALAAAGVMRGCNPPANSRSCPGRAVTRGEMAAFLARAFSLPETETDFFSDDDSSLFEHDSNRLAAAEIARGCDPPDNARFCAGEPVTREQMAAFLHRVVQRG